jgi:hypothetical protein
MTTTIRTIAQEIRFTARTEYAGLPRDEVFFELVNAKVSEGELTMAQIAELMDELGL